MAFASSLRKGQASVCCNLCQTETKINWKCLPCNLLMCSNCKDNVHSKIKSADQHKVIDIQEVGLYSKYIDFSSIKCQDHAGQTYCMFCKSCDQLVCPQCISKVHNGHGLVEISEGYQITVDKLKKRQTKAMVNIDELTKTEIKLDSLLKAEQGKFLDAKKDIQAQNKALKKAVDMHTDNLVKELSKQWQIIQKSIKKEKNRVKPLKQNMNDQIIQTEDLMKSNNAGKVFHESNQLSQSLNDVQPIDVEVNFKLIPRFLPGEITQNNVGSLQDVSTDINITISKQLTTDISKVFYISTCSDGTLWISDHNVTQKVKPETDNLKVMSSYNMKIYGMAVTPSNNLLLANGPRLQQISGSSGQVTDAVYSVDPLDITTVHVTSDYKVMVGARTTGPAWPATGRRVAIRMNKEGKHEKTYEHDRNKQPIFTYVRGITTTTNGTIFVVDTLSDDNRGRVVVLGQDGDVINTYTGHPRINNNDKPFRPVYAVTTPLDNIIVTDLDTDNLHVLNSEGHHITHYNTENIGILRPFSLSFTSSRQLYTGCTTPVGSTDNGKLYIVDISQI